MTRILLVGGGHSHLEILRRFQREKPARVEIGLVSAGTRHHYSGMVPGYLGGAYEEGEIAFDLEALSAAAGASFLRGTAIGIDPDARRVRLALGREVSYDLVSFGVGSQPIGSDRADVAEHAAIVKPMSKAVELRQRLLALARGDGAGQRRIVVVGGGAAGVEIALALEAVLAKAGRPRAVSILEGAEALLDGYSDAFRRRAERVLAQRSVAVWLGQRVAAVGPDYVEREDAARAPSDLTVWLTGAVAFPIFRDAGLALDERGFLLVDDSLRSITDSRVFAAGDCGTLVNYPRTPKAGVYAVRQGPLLWESLMAAVREKEPPRYRPQEDFLSILNTNDGKSLLRYGSLVSHSRWAWWLKDAIDRGFVRKYRRLYAG